MRAQTPRHTSIALTFIALLGASLSFADPAWPEGYGERWQRVAQGWIWSPDARYENRTRIALSASDGEVTLEPGHWFFLEARGRESFRILPKPGQISAAASLDAWAVTRGTGDVGPVPEHLGPPPRRTGLLAVHLPWSVQPLELRLELDPGQAADWIGIRCTASQTRPYHFSVDAHERVRPAEIWERLERAVRRSHNRDWPAPLDPETLPGHDVGRFLRFHRMILPWAPADDTEDERRLRAAAWVAMDLLARPLVEEHVQLRRWEDETVTRYRDEDGHLWMRAETLEKNVEGPAVLRVRARLAWPALAGDQFRNLDLTVRVGDVEAGLSGWPGADIEETTELWDRGHDDERTLLSSPREVRVRVPPGVWPVKVISGSPAFLNIEEATSIEQREHRSPFRTLKRFPGSDGRSRVCEALALELLGDIRGALQILESVPVEFTVRDHDVAPLDGSASLPEWILTKRLTLALSLRDIQEADRIAPLLAMRLRDVRADLASEVRLSLLRYAVQTGRDGMAGVVSTWIFDDPPAEPEDFTEALSAWCTGRRPFERMRAYPVSAPPATLRRFLRDVEARSIREVFGTWADLGTVGTTAGGRRWLIPIEPQIDGEALRGDAYSAWLNLRSQSGAGPWFVSAPGDLRCRVTGDGSLQVLPAADWLPPVALDIFAGTRNLGRLSFRDPNSVGLVSFHGIAPLTPVEPRPTKGSSRVYLWRGQHLLLGQASEKKIFTARFADSPRSIQATGHTPETWAFLTELFPLQGPAGSPRSLDFRGETYARAGIVRYRFGVSRPAAESERDLDVPFEVLVGGRDLAPRRLLWIWESAAPPGHPGAASPRPDTYAPGPVVSGEILVGPGPALVRLQVDRKFQAWGSASELDVAGTPPAMMLRRALGTFRRAPPSGLWEGPVGVTGDISEAADTALATRAVLDAVDGEARAAALEARGRLMFRMGREQARKDFEEAAGLYPRDSEGLDRVRVALAVLSFRGGLDLEVRSRVEELVRAGARSREIFLLAAAAALGTDDLPGAMAWMELARAEEADGSVDLERLVATALQVDAPPGEAADALMRVMTDLLKLRRMDPVKEVGPALEEMAKVCEREALLAAARYMHGRGARFAAWGLEARLLAPYAGTSDWPPPRGVLAPFERTRDLRQEEIVSTPPRVRLAGRFGAWPAVWMTAGAELLLELPGPELYEIEWRSAHGVEDGAVLRGAAPARLLIDGLPGMAAHAVVASQPSPETRCERIPWAIPGTADSWRVLAPSGSSRVRLRLQSGAGFLTVRRVVGPSWMAWDARVGSRAPATPFPPPLPTPSFSPDPGADLIADVIRRIDASRKASGPAEALTALADDLLFAVLARPAEASPDWVVRALDLYLKSHADGLGNPHWQAHYDLSRVLTRWAAVDLSADLPEFRRVRITHDLPDDPALAVSNALFFPFPDDRTSVLFDSTDEVVWHHRSVEAPPLVLEVVAATDPDSGEAMHADVQVDGAAAARGVLEKGKVAVFRLPAAKEALISVRVGAANPAVRVRARVRLMIETAAGRVPVVPERRGLLYRAPAGRINFEVRGPTLARLETWEVEDLKATEDPGEWAAVPAPIARTILHGVPRAGAAQATFELPREMFVRLSVRTVDAAALALAAPPPVPAGDIASESDAPPAPAFDPPPVPPGNEQWLLVEYPGMVEAFGSLSYRDPGSRSFSREDPERDEARGGFRLHWKAYELPVYLRFSFEGIKESGSPGAQTGQVRIHHYFLDHPDLDWRLDLTGNGQYLDRYEHSFVTDLRLRWRIPADEQLLFFIENHFNHWWSSIHDRSSNSREPYPTVWTQYREDHRRWLAFEGRMRVIPWQNTWIDVFAGTRSNDTLRPWDADRYNFGMEVKVHYEHYFWELGVERVNRLEDRDRDRDSGETYVGATLAYERWLSRGTWMMAEASFRWSPTDHSREASFGMVLRFGGRNGDRLDAVDPELVRFRHYQQGRYPWR